MTHCPCRRLRRGRWRFRSSKVGVVTVLVDGQLFSDDELLEQALAADPDQPIADDALPLAPLRGGFPELLPAWYMPAPSGSVNGRRRPIVAAVVIFSLLLINAMG